MNELASFNPVKRVSRSNPSIVMRANFINKIFYNGIFGLNILISSNCKTAIVDFTNTKEAADGTKDKTKVKDGKSGISYQQYGHLSDLTDYIICEAFKDEYYRYQNGDSLPFRVIGTNPISTKNRM